MIRREYIHQMTTNTITRLTKENSRDALIGLATFSRRSKIEVPMFNGAGIVDQDHRRDAEAPEDVEGPEAGGALRTCLHLLHPSISHKRRMTRQIGRRGWVRL